MMWWERWTRSSTRARAWWTSARSTGACSSTTCRWGSTPRRSSGRSTVDAKLRTLLETVAGDTRPGRHRPRVALAGPRSAGAAHRGRGARIQQPLPARPRRRLGHTPADRRRAAGGDRDRGPVRDAAAVARMEHGGVRRRVRRAGTRGRRRRGAPPRPAAAVPHPPPRVLHVRIARGHPGASPSARTPDGAWEATVALVKTAVGREPAIDRQPARRGPTWT